MFSKRDSKTIKEQQYQQLAELCSVFASYRHSFHTPIPETTVGSMVSKLDTLLRTNHPQLKVGVLFESLNYEVLLTSENPVEQRKIARLLRVHQKLKVPVDGRKSCMCFLLLLDAAKKAMEEGTLGRDTAEDIRFLIHEHRDLFISEPRPSASYGTAGQTRTLRELKNNRTREVDHSQKCMESTILEAPTHHENIDVQTRPNPGFDSSSISNLFFTSILGGAFLAGAANAIKAAAEPPTEPSKTGYISL